MKLKIKKINPNAKIPTYGSKYSSGFDLYAVRDQYLYPQSTNIIETGLAFSIPEGFEVQIRPRSGMSANTKVRVAFGTIDQDYTGEIKIIADNTGNGGYQVKIGDRVAQAVLVPVIQAEFEEVEELGETERGENGFGSTGK